MNKFKHQKYGSEDVTRNTVYLIYSTTFITNVTDTSKEKCILVVLKQTSNYS